MLPEGQRHEWPVHAVYKSIDTASYAGTGGNSIVSGGNTVLTSPTGGLLHLLPLYRQPLAAGRLYYHICGHISTGVLVPMWLYHPPPTGERGIQIIYYKNSHNSVEILLQVLQSYNFT